MTLESLLQRDNIPEDIKEKIKLALTDQRKAKENLIKTKTRYQNLLKSSPAVIYSCESQDDFQTTFMSENVKEITGFGADEFLFNPNFWINGIHPEDRQQAVENFEDIVQKEYYSEIYRFKNKDGFYLWMMDEASLVRDQQGNIIEIVGYWTDITKQKEAEDKFRASEEKYRSLFENIPIGLYRSTPDHKFLAANQTFIKQVGMSSFEDLLSIDPDKLATKRNYNRDRFLNEIARKGQVKGLEFELKKSDGTSIFIRENARAIKDVNGKIICYEGSVEDITDRVLTEEALRESEERLRAFMDSATDSFLQLDSELNIIEANKNLIESWNLNKKEILGKNITELAKRVKVDTTDDYEEKVSQLSEILQTGEKFNEEFTVIHPEYGEGYSSVTAFKVGSGLGMIARDITVQKQAEIVREELEQNRENFIYMATHELRTPLTVISGYCDFLDKHDQFIAQPRRESIIKLMKSNINRLERLIEDVTQVAQIQKEQFQVFKREFNLCEFLNKIFEQYNQILEDQFTFQKSFTQQSIMVKADPDRLQQALENVISNAIKHTSREKREIILKVEIQGRNIQFIIRDNGAGISPEHLNTIFEQFVTFPTEYATGGTGIGLYLARKILEAHDGKIIAQSAGKGHGSSFIIELPIS
ncbi:MAG: sensor histidine kinase [Candidatus Hodarchaeales archaeon]|jgi:PAS domain S-box-containing protein